MTEGDFAELVILAGLYGLAFTCPAPRWRMFWSLHAMALNMLAGRVFILTIPDAYMAVSAVQVVLAVVFVFASETLLGVALGLLYAVMAIGGGMTALGYLSESTSNGLAGNYWSIMSVATFAQFVVVLFHVIRQWQNNGMGSRRHPY